MAVEPDKILKLARLFNAVRALLGAYDDWPPVAPGEPRRVWLREPSTFPKVLDELRAAMRELDE